MAGSSLIKDRIREEYSTLLDNFTNLLRASKIRETSDINSGAPGDFLEVFVEKMLASCSALLSITAELKSNALLNDIEGRNSEVEARRVQTWQDDGVVAGFPVESMEEDTCP